VRLLFKNLTALKAQKNMIFMTLNDPINDVYYTTRYVAIPTVFQIPLWSVSAFGRVGITQHTRAEMKGNLVV